MARATRSFCAAIQVLAPDARGVGDTTPFSKAPSIEEMARDVAAFLDLLAIETAIVGGCSMGGYTALEFARQFPTRLRGLILSDTRADADSPAAKTARDEMIIFARQNDGAALADKMLPKLLSEQTPQLVQQVRDFARPLRGENAAKLIEALRNRRDSTPVLSSLEVPTLVIGGRADAPSPPDVMAHMATQIPRSKHVIVEDAGHLSSLEQSENWNREVDLWLLQWEREA